MKIQRLFAFCCCLFIVTHAAIAQETPEVIDEVIAMVGGEYILLSELEEQYALSASQSALPLPPNARCAILDQLLVGKLLYNQSKLDSIEVTPEEVEQQLNARIDRILAYMNNDISQFEEYYGQSITATKDQFREDLREQLASERMRGQVIREVTVTPSEVKTFFAQIPTDSLPYFNSEVEIAEIVHQPVANEATKKAAREKLASIREEIMNEEISFADAAMKYSVDGSRQTGGDLGWARRGKFVPEFEAAAYNLEPDEISNVIESEFGYHIIKLQERRGNSIHVSHILIRPEVKEEDIEKGHQYLDSIRNLIFEDSLTFSYAVKRFGFDKVPSYNNDGRMQNPATGGTIFETGDLDPDVYFTIDDMEVGDISEPLEYRGPTGDVMLRLVQLQSETRPHQASLDRDYSKIQIATKQAKQNEYLGNWIDKTLGSTFIWIDSRYDRCEGLGMWLENSRTVSGSNVTTV
ncbi:MAG: peptidylprolyl isomerase, partial [Bacteroidota bacterium]